MIYLTPAVLARAKARVAANSPMWTALKAAIDPAASWDVRPLGYALGYALTGSAAYADKAIQLAGVFVSQGVAAIEDDDGYECRQVLPEVAITLNWCGDRLSAAQQATWRSRLAAMAQWVWPETNPSRAGAWGVDDASSNYWHGFAETMVAGLALGDASLVDAMVARFKANAVPRMRRQWAGGAFEEGTAYGSSGSAMWMAYYLTAYFTATGQPATSLLPADWYPTLLRAFLHLTTPDMAHLYPAGDQARVSSSPLSSYARLPVLAMMAYLPDADAGMARFWLDTMAPPEDQLFASLRWAELLWYRDDLPAVDYRATLRTTYAMPGVGVTSTRSSWAADAVQLVAVAGPVSEDSHQDQTGTVWLTRGGDTLAGFAKQWSHDGTEHQAPSLNTVVIGGKPQPPKTDGCRALFTSDTPAATSWAADLTGAYPDDLIDWRREWLFVKPNWLVLLDRLRVKDATVSREWRLHTQNAPQISGQGYRAAAGGSRLFGAALLPAGSPPVAEIVASGGYRVKHAASGETLTRFLHVWEAAPAAQTAPTPVVASVVDATHLTLSLGGVAVNVDLGADTSQPTPALTLAGANPPPPPPPPPPPDPTLAVSVTASPTATGATFSGMVRAAAALPDGTSISIFVRTPDGRSATAAATIAGSGPPPPPPPGPTVLLADDFNGTALGSLWTPGVVVSGGARNANVKLAVVGGTLTLTPVSAAGLPNVKLAVVGGTLTLTPVSAAGLHYNGILSTQRYDLTGATATVEVVQVTQGSANTQLALVADAKNFLLLETEGGRLFFTEVLNGVRTQPSVPYDAGAMRWWRLRHDAAADTVAWETSADGRTWSIARQGARRVPLPSVQVALAAGSWEIVAAPGKAVFGSVRVERG